MNTRFESGRDTVASQPAIGTLKINEDHWQTALVGDRYQAEIHFDYSIALPTTVLALRMIDVGSPEEIHLQTYVDNVHSRGLTVHLNSHDQTCHYRSWLDYMVVDGTNHLLQAGTVDSHSLRTSKHGRDVVSRIVFRYPYNAPPRVFVALAGLGIGGERCTAWEIRTFATNVDSQGFTLHIEKRKDLEEIAARRAIGNAQVSWFAYPEGGPPGLAMCSGEVRLGGSELTPGVVVDGEFTINIYEECGRREAVRFTKRFRKPPQVLLGLTSLDSGRPHNVRIHLDLKEVTEEHMEWTAKIWSHAPLNSASFAYLAVGSV